MPQNEIVVTARRRLCNAGNIVESGSDAVGNASLAMTKLGLGVGGTGVVTGQPELVGLGVSAIDAGGIAGEGAGILQVGGGV